MTIRGYDELQLADLIGALPPAPDSWVDAARELPRTLRELDEVLPRIEQDEDFRRQASLDLERALEQAGVEARPELVDALRRRLAPDVERG